MTFEPVHPQVTRRSSYRYCFTSKHHGAGSSDDARWSVTNDQEFAIFDDADHWEVHDDDIHYYGVLRENGNLVDIGTRGQQVAKFRCESAGSPWHGYPLYPVNDPDGPSNRASAKMRPPKSVFERLESIGFITKQQRKRLFKGDHA
jgi:hypothetical protein